MRASGSRSPNVGLSDFAARAAWLRRRLGGLALDQSLRALSAAGKLHPEAWPSRSGVRVTRDVVYRRVGGLELRLDVYAPAGAARGEPAPAMLYVHGGAFQILSKDTHWMMGLAFARRGFVVFNVDYRLAPKHPFPAGLEDAAASALWVHEHAAEYGADPARLFVAGESAGANFVTALAVAASYDRPEPWARELVAKGVAFKGALPLCGILQVTDCARFGRRRPLPVFVSDRLEQMERAYLGRARADQPGGLELADPLVVLERGEKPARPLPRFFVPVGTRDPILDDTRRLAAALDALGAPCTARYYEGEMHAFHAFVWRARAVECWREMFTFVDECMAPEARDALAPEARDAT